MKDIKQQLEKLAAEADDCDLIAKLAGDPAKRETFRRLASKYRSMHDELQRDTENMPKSE